MFRPMYTLLFLSLCSIVLAGFDKDSFFPFAVTGGFTTLPNGFGPSQVATIPLSLDALGATKISSGVTENVVAAPGGAPANALAIQAVYPKGSYIPTAKGAPRGGFGFYFPGPQSFTIENVNELLFSYAVYFPQNFNFNMGGVLPGPYGGTSAEDGFGCSGGRQQGRENCFDLRLMWSTGGEGSIYAYLPANDANNVLKTEIAGTFVPDSFGISIARGAFSFAAGSWTVVAQRVKLNDNGKANGELELIVNGNSTIHATGLVIRVGATSQFRGIHSETFFGGDDPADASPLDQSAFFAGFSAAAVKPGASPADGKAAYPLVTFGHPLATPTVTGGSGNATSSAHPAASVTPGGKSGGSTSGSPGGKSGDGGSDSPGVNSGGAVRGRIALHWVAAFVALSLALL